MVLLLAGGGDAADERPVLDRFVELVEQEPIAYWPVASRFEDYASSTAFAEAALGREVDTWIALADRSPDELCTVGGIMIGGGNTFHLLNEVRRSGYVTALSNCAARIPLYGGSAGAILFGSDIATASYFDSNDVGLTETEGLGLAGPFAVWCHYEAHHDELLRSWARQNGRPIIVLTERAGVEIADGVMTSIGHESVLLLDEDGQEAELSSGESTRLDGFQGYGVGE